MAKQTLAAHYPAYNRYYPRLGEVVRSVEYEIGDESPDIRTVEWIVKLLEIDGIKYLQLDTITRRNGKVEQEQQPSYHDLVRVKPKTSILSQAYKLLAQVTELALSANQYANGKA